MRRDDYPQTPRLDLVEELHGRPVADPYRWLEDAADAATEAWSQAQDALFEQQRAQWPGRDRLRTRVQRAAGRRRRHARRSGAASGSSSCAAPPSRSTPCC